MKRYFGALCGFAIVAGGQAVAQGGLVPVQAFDQAERYAAAIGCHVDVNEIGGDRSISLVLEHDEGDGIETGRYLILTGASVGCLGGSGTDMWIPVTVEKGPMGSAYYVVPELSYPASELGDVNLRTVSAATALASDKIEVVWMDWSDDDAGCCPSIEKTSVLTADADGRWK